MKETALPLDSKTVARLADDLGFDIKHASIREMNKLVDSLERAFDMKFIRMEFGIPGLETHPVGIEAEIQALRRRKVSHRYAPFDGVPILKKEAAEFVRLFMNVEVPPSSCVPTVGAMQGCFAAIALAGRLHEERKTILFLDPGFPVNALQVRFLGFERASIDLFDHRGDALLEAIEERVRRGDVSAVMWSSPNNPTWVCLTEEELAGIGRICDQHELIAIEDLAYFGMDQRRDYYEPGVPPFQPTVLSATRRGICLISASKIFSYAGQRIALAVISPELVQAKAPALEEYYGTDRVGHAFIHGILYPMTACVPESPQYGLQALLRAANSGDRSVFSAASVYAERAKAVKSAFLKSGFRLVYDKDLDEPLSDGFYFTISYPGFDEGSDLVERLLLYGISAITLDSTGSCRREGLRACVSMIDESRFDALEQRLAAFHRDHPCRRSTS